MSPSEIALLVAGGAAAGVVNTLAGGGSLLTVPLLVLIGLPGPVANGTNRVGIAIQSAAAAWRFRAEGVSGFRRSLPVLLPICVGSLLGAVWISNVSDAAFKRLFGGVMLLLLIPTLRPPRAAREAARPWPMGVVAAAFFAIGLYGGALQAGVGLVLVMALSRTGFDLVLANSVKVVVTLAYTLLALPVFVAQDQIAWAPALLLSAGFAVGGALGARIAVRGGERVIRPVLAVCVVALAGRMLGLY
jgi:hypothetical protein